MKNHQIDLCGAEGGGRSPDMPILEKGVDEVQICPSWKRG